MATSCSPNATERSASSGTDERANEIKSSEFSCWIVRRLRGTWEWYRDGMRSPGPLSISGPT